MALRTGYDHYQSVLIFIGAPRSGTSITGDLINHHPACLVSHELNILERAIRTGMPFDRVVRKAKKSASRSYRKGSVFTDQSRRQRYQPRWQEPPRGSVPKMLPKSDIVVVGDKKAGGTALAYKRYPKQVLELLHQYPKISLLQMVRNPADAAASYLRSHPHEVQDFETAFRKILHLNSLASECVDRSSNPSLRVYYEDLVSNPRETLGMVCQWLGVHLDPVWVDYAESRISESHSLKSHQLNERCRGLLHRLDPILFDRYFG